jgi:ABC-type transport system involved in multi-copper enzyme maturation permease subunit
MIATLRQRLAQPGRLILLIALFGFPLLFVMMARAAGLQILNTAGAFALVLGAGMLGSDHSAGVLQLLFVRPVTRTEYVLSRWGAVALGAATLAVMQVMIAWTLLSAQGSAIPIAVAVRQAIEQALGAFAMTSVIAMFSSALPGIGDVIAVFCAQIGSGVLATIGGFARQPVLERIGHEFQQFFSPQFSWMIAFGGASPSWFHLASYLSTLTLGVAIAVVVTQRRELSYASA